MPRPTKKAALAAATKMPNQHTQLIINSIVHFPPLAPPAMPKPSPTKRKNTMVLSDGDSSDIEIIEGPRPSPKKKARSFAPLPGAAVSKDISAASIPDSIEETIRTSSLASESTGRPRAKSAAAIPASPDVSAIGHPSPTNKRTAAIPALSSPVQLTGQNTMPSTPSKGAKNAKASKSKPAAVDDVFLDNDIEMNSPLAKESQSMSAKISSDDLPAVADIIKDLRPRRLTKAKSLVGEVFPDTSATPSTRFKIVPKKRATKAGTQPTGEIPDVGSLSDDDLPEVSDLALSTPKKGSRVLEAKMERIQRPPALTSMLDVEAVEHGTDSGMSDQGSDRYLATDDDGSVGYQTDDAPAPEELSDHGDNGAILTDDEDAIAASSGGKLPQATEDLDVVTSHLYQDPAIKQIYKGLPHLEKLRPIVPYSKPASQQSADENENTTSCYTFSKIALTLSASETDSLLRAMMFTQSGYFVNFSRIHPNLLRNDKGRRIRMARSDNAAAVGIYTGLCTRGSIVDVEVIGPSMSPYEVHGVSVAGSDQETRRYMSLVNLVLGLDEITGNMSRLGLSFYTRGQGKDGNFGPSTTLHSAPPQVDISPLISSVAMPGSNAAPRGYPGSRSFDERIPVYDGRAATGRKFSFTDADFQNLASWPLYRGRGEIEKNMVISVGHTVGTYRDGRYLSTDIHFVIILGKPAIGL